MVDDIKIYYDGEDILERNRIMARDNLKKRHDNIMVKLTSSEEVEVRCFVCREWRSPKLLYVCPKYDVCERRKGRKVTSV